MVRIPSANLHFRLLPQIPPAENDWQVSSEYGSIFLELCCSMYREAVLKTDWPVRYRHTNNAIEIRIVIIFSKVFNLIPPLFVKIQPYGSINGIKMQLFGSIKLRWFNAFSTSGRFTD